MTYIQMNLFRFLKEFDFPHEHICGYIDQQTSHSYAAITFALVVAIFTSSVSLSVFFFLIVAWLILAFGSISPILLDWIGTNGLHVPPRVAFASVAGLC